MNILLTSLMVPGSPSGVRLHYERLAELLRAQGHSVTIITLDSLRPAIRRSIGVLRRGLTLALGQFGEQMAIEVGRVAEIYFAIDRHASYDVVNAQDVSSGWAARLALRNRVPVVVTGHFNDHPAEEMIHQQGFKGLTAKFLHRWYDFLFHRTRYFIGVSDYVRRRTAPWLPAEAEHTVVYNGVNMQQLARPQSYALQASQDLRSQFPGRRIILNIGQLEGRKNQRYLVKMAAELRQLYPDFVLGLVGTGDDEELLRQMIAEADLQEHVVLLGYHRNVVPLLHAADLYVHAATRENCPLVLLEAMGASCPAVALAVGGIPELLAPTPEALVPPATAPRLLAQELRDLFESPAALARLQRQQHAYGEAHFDAEVMLARTLDFFEKARRQLRPAPLIVANAPARAEQAAYAEASLSGERLSN